MPGTPTARWPRCSTPLIDVAVGVEVHVGGRGERRLLAEVEEGLEDVVRAVAVGAGGDPREAELGHLAVEGAAERIDDLGVAGAALGGRRSSRHFVGVGALDRVRGVAVGAGRRRESPFFSAAA